MAGILGDLFGLGGGTQAPTPGLLDAAGYMDPAQYDRMRQQQSMMGLWAGLLAGGGPSLSPRNFGSALGAGLTGAQQFGSQFDESQRYRAEAQKNLADITAKKQGFELAKEYLKGGVLPGGGGGAAAPGVGSSTPNFGAGSGGGGGDPRGVEPYIRAEAARLNIDPDIAVRVARSEGLGTFLGDGGKSGGAFQLYTGGGVGNMFQRDTGLSPLDPANEKATITYALQHAAQNGWGAWNGAKKIGITGFTGIGQRGGAPATTTELSAVPDFAGMFSGNQGASYAPAGQAAPAPAPTILAAPGANPNAPAAPGAGAALPGGVSVRPLAGEAVPAEAAPSFGYGSAGGAISPAALAAAAGGAPPVPNAMVAPAPPVPAPAPPVTQPPVAAAAPAPGATRPPGGPGEVTVTLPKPPALGEMLPVPAAQPQPLPPAPEIPGIPARPQIPGATPGAAVSPAVAARARQAQGVVLGLSMMGVHVPDFLQKEAGIEVAGRTAAAEAEAKQPIELQNKAFEASLTAAQKRWDALTDQQKETLAFQRGLTKDQMNAMYANVHEQYKSLLGLVTAGPISQAQAEGALPSKLRELTGKTDEELRAAWDKPDKIVTYDAAGTPYTRIATPRQLYAEVTGTQPPGAPPGPLGAAPIPGALAPGTTSQGVRTGVGPGREEELRGGAKQTLDYTGAVQTEAQSAVSGRADIDQLLARGPNIDWRGPGAALKQQFNRVTSSVLGVNTESVASYEMVQQLMGDMTRRALRASDPNPTERQQQMMLASFPTPASSPAGYVQGLRHMQGIADWKVYRQEALADWRNQKGTADGFQQAFKFSAIPFVVSRMPEAERTQYFTQLYRADPKAYDRLVEQMKDIKGSNINFQY